MSETDVTEISTAKRAPAKRSNGTKAPATARQPQDHKRPAAQLEAEGVETVTVEWDGLAFEIPTDPDSWDFWTVTHPLAAGNIPVALTGLLGPEQSMRLRLAKPQLSNPEARELFDTINRAIGMGNTGN